ncbi:hypothetical protein SUDANB108_00026 [Streptomyces sp. enrichment culture]|uniref:Dyp-type peroxidase n=1 Tax=Streptomyces sp. enrichment culture TaxID=1795815 RepID=UPI003F56B792
MSTAPAPAPATASNAALPLRQSTQIQGDILAGFRKDHTTVLFLHFTDAAKARGWLKEVLPRIATTAQVAAFNAEFSAHRKASGGEDPDHLKVTWLNLSLTYPGIQLFTGKDQIFEQVPRESTLDAYMQGAAARAEIVGDVDDSAPEKWSYGNATGQDERVVHGVLTLASDDDEELIRVIKEQKAAIAQASGSVVFHQKGAVLPGKLAGKEHFGFKDGVSQPGVIGYDEEDPAHPGFVKGKPGTKLLPAGEFLVGYDRLNTGNPRTSYPKDQMPEWMKDGSFHVVRRLHQDVHGWWGQVEESLRQLKKEGAVPEETDADWLAARFVGRWPNGTSLTKCPMRPPADDQEPDNDLDFADDPDGLITPLFSHTRKSAPRAGLVNSGKKVTALLNEGRRMIRRGTPYGKPIGFPGPDGEIDAPRGMAFSCYQADIIGSFEFIQKRWIVNSDNPQGRDPKAGPDAMIAGMLTGITDGYIGYEHTNAQGSRACTEVQIMPFVRTQGCVYSFAPSLDVLRRLTEGRLDGPVPEISSGDPHGSHVDAMLADPGDPHHFWTFQGPLVRPVKDARGTETTNLLTGSSAAVSSWRGLDGLDSVDAVLPVPGHPDTFWVFFTGKDGRQHYRNVTVHGNGADTPDSQTTGAATRDLSDWHSFSHISHIDTFVPIPDQQPNDNGQYFYWVFHTTSDGQRYRIVSIEPDAGHRDHKVSDDRPLTTWPSLDGVSRVDAVQAVPGKQHDNGESWYWVFHENGYRIIAIADDPVHTDHVVQEDRPLSEWNSPS